MSGFSYVIFGGIDPFDGQPMFWNNNDGWVDLSDATMFPWQNYWEDGDEVLLVPYDQRRRPIRVRLPCLTPTSSS